MREEEEALGHGTRIIDEGGGAADEQHYDGPVLCIFAIDPGVSTGWVALKVPVLALRGGSVARTLSRCRYLGGTIRRSGSGDAYGGGGSFSASDSAHVTEILSVAREVYGNWMPEWVECDKCDGEGFFDNPEGSCRDECEVCEGEGGEWDVENSDQFTFTFVLENFSLRNESMDPSLLAPVRVNSIFMDRLMMNESELRAWFQSPSDAKNSVTDDRLRRWGFWSIGSAHERDAARHAILFLRRFAANADIRIKMFGHDPLA